MTKSKESLNNLVDRALWWGQDYNPFDVEDIRQLEKDIMSGLIPAGHVAVPLEPTEAMIEAGEEAENKLFRITDIYKAMIAAAQKGE